jgi:hypothetical protein
MAEDEHGMDTWIRIDLPPVVWSVLILLALLAAMLIGFPILGRGGGLLGRRRRGYGRGRGGYRIRVGHSPGVALALALARRADTVALVAVSGAVLLLLMLNARA